MPVRQFTRPGTAATATLDPIPPEDTRRPTLYQDSRPAYAEQAGRYERRTAAFDDWRRQMIDLLPLHDGDIVLDVGCGTGRCFPLLQAKIGATGGIVGIDESPQMLSVARQRLRADGMHNVVLIESPVERAAIPVCADAALFCAVHDILASREGLKNVFHHLRPGAWVAAGGGKWTAPWLIPLNLFAMALHEPYVRDFHGFDRPWRLLGLFIDNLQVTEVAFGTGYLALGQVRRGAPHTPDRR